MFKNYFTIAIRNFMRYKAYAAINTAGLAIGMACCALILLYVQHELIYDRFHEKSDRTYRVLRETRGDDGRSTFYPGLSGPLAPTLITDFSEVETATRVWSYTVDFWTQSENRGFYHPAHQLWSVDPNFLDVFDFKLIKGDRNTVLQNPMSIVITEETAHRYFGQNDPIDKVITLLHPSHQGDYTVTGVIHIPEHSSIQFDLMTVFNKRMLEYGWFRWQFENWQPRYRSRPFFIFAVLREGVDPKVLEAKLPEFMAQHMGKEVSENNTYHLQPLTRMHLYSSVDYPGQLNDRIRAFVNGNIDRVYLFSAIAFLILVIAIVNFVNLATARSANRAKEVGLRKVSGAHRFHLLQQFLGEAMLTSFLAFALAFGLVELILPKFCAFVGKDLTPERNLSHLLIASGFVVFTGLLAGIYPAFYLSAFEPADVLKGHLKTGLTGTRLRKGLVVFQFAISILLIIGTTIIYQQLHYIQNKSLGFKKDAVINMPIFTRDSIQVARYKTIKQAFLAHANVRQATAYRLPLGARGGILRELQLETGGTVSMLVQEADEDFLNTFEIDLIVGHNFYGSVGEEDYDVLLNETAVKSLGWKDPIGKQFIYGRQMTVVGVIKDFHSQSLREEIKPLVIMNRHTLFWTLSIRVRGDDLPETLAFLEQTWKQFRPNRPFEFEFMDEGLNQLYREDHMLGQLVSIFAALAVLVACLGLFGLAAFTTEQRTKEIGIRKVLGASTSGILVLLSKEFTKLVLIGNLIAWPVAYFLVGSWLQNFAYRVSLSWWIFVFGGVLAFLIALGTVGYQAMRAALKNPVEAMRYE